MSINNISAQQFDLEVIQSRLPVLVDFWAPWCGPCHAAAPLLEQLAQKYAGKLTIVKINVDDNQELTVKYAVMSIPTVILFQHGKEIDRQIGFVGEAGYQQLINKLLQ